jgi:hypothetical protein
MPHLQSGTHSDNRTHAIDTLTLFLLKSEGEPRDLTECAFILPANVGSIAVRQTVSMPFIARGGGLHLSRHPSPARYPHLDASVIRPLACHACLFCNGDCGLFFEANTRPSPAHLGLARHSLAEAGKAMRAGLILLLISCGAFDVSSFTCALVLLRLPDARLTGRSTADTERGVQCGGRPSRSGGSGGQDV